MPRDFSIAIHSIFVQMSFAVNDRTRQDAGQTRQNTDHLLISHGPVGDPKQGNDESGWNSPHPHVGKAARVSVTPPFQ